MVSREKAIEMIKIVPFFFLVLLAMMTFHCARDPGLSDDEFVDLYIQLAIMWESCQTHPDQWSEERGRIMAQEDISLEEFRAFVERHREDPERWARIWEKIVQKLETMNQEESR